ncbi:MAG: quinone-dependent dihydroorotate dehydrogenase [Rhodospirillales bacterium]|nr:MAG: quinone-dependent dihydroorotate dehydrogenase [Rhodospirillales bacterium]
MRCDLYSLAWPFLKLIDPEEAHGLALKVLSSGLFPTLARSDPPGLGIDLWGKHFPNPVGLAAGFDKNAEAADALLRLGFGFVEVGTVTPQPQTGNPRPRLFRLVEDKAIINRMGFNNDGAVAVRSRLVRQKKLPGIVGVNLGKNKTTEDAASDYEKGIILLAPLAGYLVVNISSPNTPGLRALQGRDALTTLLGRVRTTLKMTMPEDTPPLLVKVAPDLMAEDRKDIAEVAMANGIDGLIVSNTTIARQQGLRSKFATEAGGLSGQPLFKPSTEVLADFYRLTQGKMPLVGVGGIASGADAYAKIRAGASLVQVYSAMIYRGPGIAERIKRELYLLLRRDGFSHVQEAVGADHR